MRFARKSLNFAEALVGHVLEQYSKEHYKPASPNYRLNWKARSSGAIVDSADDQMFRTIVGSAVVVLQPHFEDKLDEIDYAVYEQVPEFFDPLKFLRFCSLVTLEMARDYFIKGNFTIPETTAVLIAQMLKKYYFNGSFSDGEPTWEGKLDLGSWETLYKTAHSIMNFRLMLLKPKSIHFVPEVSPPSTPEPVLPSALVPQCHPPSIPVAALSTTA